MGLPTRGLLTRVSVENLVGRTKSFKIDLHGDVNVFFGLNGSGKTTLLRIIHSGLSKNSDPLLHTPFTGAVLNGNSQKTGDFEISIEVVKSKRPKRSGMPPWIEKTENETTEDFKSRPWAHGYLPTSRLVMEDESGTGPFLNQRYVFDSKLAASSRTDFESEIDLTFARTLQARWSEYNGQILTNIRNAQEQGLAGILRELFPTEHLRESREYTDLEIAYARVGRFLKRQKSEVKLGSLVAFKDRLSSDPNLKNIVAHIDGVEKRIEEASAPRTKLESLINRLFSGTKSVKFSERNIEITTADNREIGVDSLSSGEKHILRILVEAFSTRKSLLIIDEPEISMHVDWQRELISAIRELSPEVQLIIATHSPEIMANVPDEKIFRI